MDNSDIRKERFYPSFQIYREIDYEVPDSPTVVWRWERDLGGFGVSSAIAHDSFEQALDDGLSDILMGLQKDLDPYYIMLIRIGYACHRRGGRDFTEGEKVWIENNPEMKKQLIDWYQFAFENSASPAIFREAWTPNNQEYVLKLRQEISDGGNVNQQGI